MLQSPLFLSFVIVAVGFAAGTIPFFFRWTHVTAHRWIAFGAGTILGAAVLHMMPEAFEMSGAGGIPFILAGFLTLYLIEQVSFGHPHDEEQGAFHEIGLLSLIGFTLHDLVDGVALGSGHHIPELTPAIFLALIIHKIPTTFSFSLLLLHAGFGRKRIIRYLLILLAAIPLGVLFSNQLVALFGENHERGIGYLINFSAGTFLYIGAYELLPEMHRKSSRGSLIGLFFAMGLTAIALLKLLHPVH